MLSLLLIIPFLTVQAWALSGGAYDRFYARSMSSLSGTYGLVLSGDVLQNEANPSADPINPETTGVMTMVIPASGMATGRLLVFAQGLMYLGNAQGTVEPLSGKITLLSQVTHYVARTVSDGITKQSGVTIDAVLSGKMNLGLKLDFLSGLIEIGGDATYYKFNPLLTKLVLDTSTQNATDNLSSNQNKNENQTATESAGAVQSANATQGSSSSTTESKAINQSTNSTTTGSTANADGSVTTNSDNTGTNTNSLTSSATGANATSTDTRTSDLSKTSNANTGTTVVAGTVKNSANTITTTTFRPDLFRENPNAVSFMFLQATGIRQDTTVSVPAPFTPPTEATNFQIDLPPPSTGAGGGTTGAPGAQAAN